MRIIIYSELSYVTKKLDGDLLYDDQRFPMFVLALSSLCQNNYILLQRDSHFALSISPYHLSLIVPAIVISSQIKPHPPAPKAKLFQVQKTGLGEATNIPWPLKTGYQFSLNFKLNEYAVRVFITNMTYKDIQIHAERRGLHAGQSTMF